MAIPAKNPIIIVVRNPSASDGRADMIISDRVCIFVLVFCPRGCVKIDNQGPVGTLGSSVRVTNSLFVNKLTGGRSGRASLQNA